MSEFNIEVAGGSSVRLPTAGKYCDRDIVVTATGSAGGSNPLEGHTVVTRTIDWDEMGVSSFTIPAGEHVGNTSLRFMIDSDFNDYVRVVIGSMEYEGLGLLKDYPSVIVTTNYSAKYGYTVEFYNVSTEDVVLTSDTATIDICVFGTSLNL